MFKGLAKHKAQSTLEYAILIGVIVAGLIATQVYLKRGWQGKLKESADSMGSQFSPGYTLTNYTTKSFSNSTETTDISGTNTQIHNQWTNRDGNEDTPEAASEFWWHGAAAE
ncbi:MAG: hypothetical protein A3G38_02005 [Omnitrophica WOR_2 bacterium RIFCSPLOWO2_12_FULL_51_8]|nr:MAG: hypothetical protein A3G38_02005 [Omnitrophica WOR_2 bacterium RIFCSPLOWO2_12_FULL_51_8]